MFSKLEAPNLQITLQWVLDQTLRKRKRAFDAHNTYHLETLQHAGIPVDLTTTLADADTREFRLVKDQGNFASTF